VNTHYAGANMKTTTSLVGKRIELAAGFWVTARRAGRHNLLHRPTLHLYKCIHAYMYIVCPVHSVPLQSQRRSM